MSSMCTTYMSAAGSSSSAVGASLDTAAHNQAKHTATARHIRLTTHHMMYSTNPKNIKTATNIMLSVFLPPVDCPALDMGLTLSRRAWYIHTFINTCKEDSVFRRMHWSVHTVGRPVFEALIFLAYLLPDSVVLYESLVRL